MRLLLLVFLITLIGLSQVQSRRSDSRDSFDEDDFSDFDIDEEEAPSPVRRKNRESGKESDQSNEFTTFDDTNKEDDGEVEDEDFEDDPENLNDLNSNSNNKPKPDGSGERVASSGGQKKNATAFNMNTDDLDMEEFEHFIDDEEFEGFESTTKAPETNSKSKKPKATDNQKSGDKMPSLKIADVPMHLMQNGNWTNYIWEIVLLCFIFIYLINFLYGKSKNYRLVYTWFQAHRELLERNFAVVGDDGNSTELPGQINSETSQPEIGSLIKDSENSYGLWCTGRQMCDGMLVQLKLVKRQDLINGVLMQFIKPQSDQIIVSVEYPNVDDIDNFVFCLTNKKISQQLFNDYQDLSSYCLEKKTLPSSNGSSFGGDYKYADLLNSTVASKYTMLNESMEVPNAILDMRVCAFLNKYPDMVEYLLISDQYVGYRSPSNDDSSTPTDSAPVETTNPNAIGLPKSRCMLNIVFNIPGKGLATTNEEMEKMQPAMQLAMYLIDKVPRIRLSRDAKVKALKRRKDVNEQFMKLSHKQRQEAAMLRKEEKRRAEKEKIMNESDPEKQKRLEEKQTKIDKRKNLSKMKQVKIKSM